MTILIHIGQRQNSLSSYFTSCSKIDSAFDLSECKQESECKFPTSSGAGVTFLEAGVKKVIPITSGLAICFVLCVPLSHFSEKSLCVDDINYISVCQTAVFHLKIFDIVTKQLLHLLVS